MLRTQLVPQQGLDGPVLEIGSDGELASAKVLARLTEREVHATNLVIDGLKSRVGHWPISVTQARRDRIDFPDATFSLIFGRAVLEHIPELADFLAECHRVLQPDGVMFLEGGPLWPSPRGHHVALTVPSGKRYGFDSMPGLLSPWQHLLTDAEGMSQLLAGGDIPDEDARAIADYVYTTEDQNRVSASELIAMFTDVGFAQVRFECVTTPDDPPADLIGMYSRFDLTCHTLSATVRK